MDFPLNDDMEESLVPRVFDLPGESAVVINGLAPVS